MDFQLISEINQDRKLIGNNGCVGLGIVGSIWRPIENGRWVSTQIYTDTNRHIFRVEGYNFYLDNTLIDNSTRDVSNNFFIYIFNVSKRHDNSPDGYGGVMKIYECKILDDDTLVMHLFPVRVGQTGYLYDKVSKQLFGNQGTGNFILGPDK